MKKAFKLFGFIALSMTLAVACGNANNTPAEEEVVAEETVEAAEQVVEEVAAPATQATCDEKKEEPQMVVQEVTMEDVKKEQMVEQNKAKLEREMPTTVQEVKTDATNQPQKAKTAMSEKSHPKEHKKLRLPTA